MYMYVAGGSLVSPSQPVSSQPSKFLVCDFNPHRFDLRVYPEV